MSILFGKNGSKLKRSWDLALIIILSLLLASFIYLVPDFSGRIIIGIPFILFFPGYALVTTLFPAKGSLDTVERIALACGLSIAVVPLIGFGLNYTSFGIRLDPILWSLILFNVIVSMLGIWRRSRSKEPFLPFDPVLLFKTSKIMLHGKERTDKVLTIILVLAVISSVIAVAYIVVVPRQGEDFSEFYVLGPGGNATDYPHNLTLNQTASVILGIANHEHHTVNYTVEVWLANETISDNVTTVNHLFYVDQFSVILNHVPVNPDINWTPEWQQPFNFSSQIGGSYKIWFILQVDGTPFLGVKNLDYANTIFQDRFVNMIDSKDFYSLNLNLNITG
jgi:uncharacterized membrane protein